MAQTIIDTIAAHNRELVAEKKKKRSLETVMRRAYALSSAKSYSFRESLAKPGMSFICEVKKASPSKGLIAPDFPYVEIALAYESAGASAISCLTEPEWFMGRDEYLFEISKAVSIPVLRKDFTIDPYMIFEAKCLGACAILLICSLLTSAQLRDWRLLAEELGMDALVEAHDEKEIEMAAESGARIIGINNRNLKDFTVDVKNAARFRDLVPRDILFVSESGITNRADVEEQERIGADAVLIGETLMRAPDKHVMLNTLRGEPSDAKGKC